MGVHRCLHEWDFVCIMRGTAHDSDLRKSLARFSQAVQSLSGYTFHPIWNPVVRVCAFGLVPSILFCALSFFCSLSMASMRLSGLIGSSVQDNFGYVPAQISPWSRTEYPL